MAEGILGLGSAGSSGLNQELIDKLKAAEAKGKVDIYDTKLEDWDKELEKIDAINLKINELLTAVDKFDLYRSSANAFEQVTASSTGTSAVFDAVDIAGLNPGTTNVTVSQLAQKDVFQSSTFSDANATMTVGQNDGDKLSVQIGTADTFDFLTKDKTYQELADEINAKEGLTASIEEVGTDTYRLVIKSTDSGLDNALTITQTDSADADLADNLGYADSANHTLTAQNLNAKIDGVDYDVSSNTVKIQGNLTMTAVELGDSSITIQEDNSSILPSIKDITDKYNELLVMVDEELYSAESPISDTGTLKLIMGSIKDALFGSYGENGDLNMFNYGMSVDKSGLIIIDDEKLGKALTDNADDLKEMFVGVAERPGIGTYLKEYLDDLDGYDGLMTKYGENMTNKKLELEEEKKTAQETLDEKYSQMALQFASYTAMITQMESAFGGMKMMMDQSTAK
jgi:flagellar hook-associated protein 2